MAQVALDNLSVLEIITRGGPLATEPSPAAKAYFGQKIAAARENPTAHSAFFNNAFIPWVNVFDAPREFDSYTDKIANRRMELGVTRMVVDAHDVPGSVQNNPNDPQNELRFERYRPNYRQYMLYQNRDEFTPITIDTNEILRLMIEGGPDGTNVSNFVGSQVTMAVNRDRSAEFHTLMMAVGLTAARPNLFHVQIPNLLAGNPSEADARNAAAKIRATVKGLQDFVPFFTPARNNTTVPKDQIRLVARQSWMEALGTLAYANSFNPEYVFALPEDQIIDLPDHYFDRQPGLADKVAFLVDAGEDQKDGSLIVVDTFHNWGMDVYGIKATENRALHHSSILGTNDYKTFITIGVNAGTQIIAPQIVPSTINGVVYGASGDIANGGNLTRGQEYSTRAAVLDASGFPAGGWLVSITSTGHTSQTYVGLYNEVKIGLNDLAQQITLTFTSIIDPNVSVTRTYNIVGAAQAINGSGALIDSPAPVFAAGSGSGGTITYTLATGETAEISADNGATWTAAGASPITVPSGSTRRFRKRASPGTCTRPVRS